jgi:hypothetical protein
LWSHNFIFGALNFKAGETITIEADFYCSYCYHWYAVPRKFVPDPYTLVFVPLNWKGDLSKDGFFYTSFETYAQTHGDFAIQEVGKLTADNTKIVKVKQNLNLDFDKTDSDNFGDTQWNAIIDHAKNNKATGDVYIALTNEGLWGEVAGLSREIYGNVIVVDNDGLGNTETTAHELGHSWGMIEEYNYRSWLAEKPAIRSGYDFNSYPTSDDPSMPYPPPDYDDVRCPGRSFDGEHCIMGPAGHWYTRTYPLIGDVPWYFGGSKGFCPECSSAIDENIGKVWGSSSSSLAAIRVTLFKNGSLPILEQVEGVPFAGKFMYSDESENYSIQVQSGTGGLLYSSNITCNFVMNLPSKLENSTEMPLEVDSRTVLWLAPAFSQDMVIINIKDNEANEIVATEEVRIGPVGKAWIDYQTSDKDNYNFGDPIEVTTEVNTTETNMNVLVDATLFDPNGVVQDYRSWTGTIFPTPDPLTFLLAIPSSGKAGTWKVYVVVLNSTGQFQDSEMNLITIGGDTSPPITYLTIGSPKYTDGVGNIYVTSNTALSLTAEDTAGGTGVASTHYRKYNTTNYDTGMMTSIPPIEFHLTGIDDGEYSIDFYSVDNVGNVEDTNTQKVILDNTAPSLTIETPMQCAAVQDGVDFTISATDLSAVASVMVSIRSAQGNILSSQFELMPATLKQDGKWHLYFDTRQLPDGFYSFIANGTDVLGNWRTKTVKFSIRNWAAIQLLPSTPSNKAGRTMPIKFSIRVKASVDPAQPFIYNEELTIKIYKIASPSNLLLQTSTFGSGSTNYRIDTGTLYITNFKTQSTPATYLINIYRKGMLIGSFQFSTVK